MNSPIDDNIAAAYRLMAMDQNGHIWARYARDEVTAILRKVEIPAGARVVDVGCGSGRHALEFALRGFRVFGFDFVAEWIEKANAKVKQHAEVISNCGGELQFQQHDARQPPLRETSDLVICLYDVLGSSADPDDAHRLIEGLFRLCKPGGWLVLGCMNGLQMIRGLPPENWIQKHPIKEDLTPVATMQRCGEVFDFSKMRYRPESGELFRREQFVEQEQVVLDTLIRERRFLPSEVISLLQVSGFKRIQCSTVRAGKWEWDSGFDPDAPEVVYFAQRPTDNCESMPRIRHTSRDHTATAFSIQLIPRKEITPQHAAIVSRIFCTSFGKNPKTGKPHILGPAKMHDRLKRCEFLGLALKGNIPVGYMFGTAYNDLLAKVAWLDSICVMKEFRRQGLATALLDAFARAVPKFKWLGATSPNPITKRVLDKAGLGKIYGPWSPAPPEILDQLEVIRPRCEDLRNCEIDASKMQIRTQFSVEYDEIDRKWNTTEDEVEPPWWTTLSNLPEDYESLLIIDRESRHLV